MRFRVLGKCLGFEVGGSCYSGDVSVMLQGWIRAGIP